jgi:hypothetical protein
MQSVPAEYIKQYKRMSILFANADTRLDDPIKAGDSALARSQLRDLGFELSPASQSSTL